MHKDFLAQHEKRPNFIASEFVTERERHINSLELDIIAFSFVEFYLLSPLKVADLGDVFGLEGRDLVSEVEKN